MPRDIKPRKPPGDDNPAAGDEEEALEASAVAVAEPDPEPDPEPAPRAAKALRVVRAAPPAAAPAPGQAPVRPSAPVTYSALPPPRRTLALGPSRKVSKAQAARLEKWRGAEAGRTVSAMMQALVGQSRTKSGNSGVMMADEADKLIVGIPCPAPSFEFLIQQDCFPLGFIVQLVGKWGSLKSALLYEIFRWFARLDGGALLNENETKFSPDLCASIMGYRNPGECPLVLNRCQSVEDWQEGNTKWIADIKKLLTGTKEEPGPGRTVPFVFGTDSIMGKLSRMIQEKVQAQGSSGLNRPVEANIITSYIKSLPQEIDGWPFAVVLVNHLKMRRQEDGTEERGKAGGVGVDFQETLELETRVVRSKLEAEDFDGVQVEIKCVKNSIGITGRKIQTRMLWWAEDDPETGEPVQRTVFDWDWSTVHTLSNLKGPVARRLKDLGFHLEVTKKSDVENAAWSRTLGIPKSDPQPWHVVGRALREDPAALDLYRRALMIKRRAWLQGAYLERLGASPAGGR